MNGGSRLSAVVFDWAGTIVDFGSRAPMGAFVETFERFDVPLTIAEARGPMGLPKRNHIAALLRHPQIAERWRSRRGRTPNDSDIAAVYDVFLPLNAAVVADYGQLIPGVLPVIETLRAQRVKIGSTTGYTREIMARLVPVAAQQGYVPDNLVCAGDLAEGRPSPLMMYRTFADLGVYPPTTVVKVDDTEPGIAEGIAAGTWAVGVALTGNLCGCTETEVAEMTASQREAVRTGATRKLRAAGAHDVIDSVADLFSALERLGLAG